MPERARRSVAASDAFFPFAGGLRMLLHAGVTMYLTGARHFAH